MTVYTIADVITGLIESVMMIMLCEIFFKRKNNLEPWVYIADILAATVAINVSNIVFKYDFLNVVILMAIFFAMTFIYDGKFQYRAVIAILYYAIVAVVEVATMFSITVIFNISVATAVDNPQYRLLGIFSSKIISLFVANAMRLKYKNQNIYHSTSYWVLFFVSFITTGATMFLLFKLTYTLNKSYFYIYAALSSFSLLISTFFSLYLYEHLSKQEEIIRIHQQYEQQMKMQMSHYDEVLISQRQLKEFKHDFKNCMIGVRAYMNKNDAADVGKYSGELNDRFSKADRNLVETGNPALDAVLSTKKAIAQSKNIEFNMKLQIPENLPANAIDICIIFGNALDNAIEACVRTNRTDAKIDVAIVYRANALYCKIVNTAPPPEKKKIKTSKSDKANHGYGLENIRTALAKYDTEPKIEHTGDKFTFEFLMFIN